jgi:hypothetical protein
LSHRRAHPNGDLSLAFPGTAVGLPAVQVTGPFAGLDGGASSHLTITDGTFMTRKLECGDPKGLKSLTFGDGSLSLG